MDLQAYTNIDNLEHIAEENRIHVPRLRGYSLMSEEEPISEDEIKQVKDDIRHQVYKNACVSIPPFHPESNEVEFSVRTDRIREKYLTKDGELRWELLHGKRRKNVKFALKKALRSVEDSCAARNRYAGRDGVLRIHARIGGGNWGYYGGRELSKQPWFIEKYDDPFDNTYCDIYAKVEIVKKDMEPVSLSNGAVVKASISKDIIGGHIIELS